jgi:hypothetical protein
MSTAMSHEIYEDELKQLWIAVLTPSSMRRDLEISLEELRGRSAIFLSQKMLVLYFLC